MWCTKILGMKKMAINYEVVTITELRIISGNPTGKMLNIARLAKTIHEYIMIDGYIFDKKAAVWVENHLNTIKKTLDVSGERSSECIKEAFTLLKNSLMEHERRITCQPRPKKVSEQVAVAA